MLLCHPGEVCSSLEKCRGLWSEDGYTVNHGSSSISEVLNPSSVVRIWPTEPCHLARRVQKCGSERSAAAFNYCFPFCQISGPAGIPAG